MHYLLDTHALIWFINGDKELSTKARKAIESESSIKYISIASLWEMAIKISLGRLSLKTSFDEIKNQIEINNFQILHISFDDTLMLSTLKFHHRDPFDRMIVVQGITNKLTIVSKDNAFEAYKVKTLW
jgi:PIN domain nuclease of toxin-antitoxin system